MLYFTEFTPIKQKVLADIRLKCYFGRMDCFVSVPFCSNLIGKVAKGVNSGFLASIGAVSCFWGEKEAFTPAMIDDDLPF